MFQVQDSSIIHNTTYVTHKYWQVQKWLVLTHSFFALLALLLLIPLPWSGIVLLLRTEELGTEFRFEIILFWWTYSATLAWRGLAEGCSLYPDEYKTKKKTFSDNKRTNVEMIKETNESNKRLLKPKPKMAIVLNTTISLNGEDRKRVADVQTLERIKEFNESLILWKIISVTQRSFSDSKFKGRGPRHFGGRR